MRINWFKDENNLVYINGATQLAELERTLHFPGLEEAANELRKHPTPEGFTIKGMAAPAAVCSCRIWPSGSISRWGRTFSSSWGKCRSAMSSTGWMRR